MDVADPQWAGDLGVFLRERLTAGMVHARVRVVGSGMHRFTPVQLPPGLQVEIRVEPTTGAERPSWSPTPQTTGPALIELHGGALVLSQVDFRHDPESRLENLIAVEDAHLVLVRCQLTVPPGSTNVAGGLISFRAVTTRPKSSDPLQGLFTVPVDRPACRLVESTLVAHGTALRAELGRGLVALSQCAVAAGEAALELVPARVARGLFDVDLMLDQSTMVAERSLIRLGPWPGLPPGPDRPWLVTSRDCAFLALSQRRPRETAMLRGDADALARGTVFWQAANDAVDVDLVRAAEDGPASTSPNPLRDVQTQWVRFWGPGHMSRITGPHGSRSLPSVRLLDRPRPGRIEPADLILDQDYHPGRDRLDVGADLARQGIVPRAARPGVRRP
jgi:serine/threonine-protein kinase